MATTPIKYRISSVATKPTTDSVKGAPLTSLEIDGNFRSIKDSIDAEGARLDASIATQADRIDDIILNGIGSILARHSATATAGQTVFDLPFTYSPGANNLVVFVNGLLSERGADYTETSGTRVTFNSGLEVGQEVTFLTNVSPAPAAPLYSVAGITSYTLTSNGVLTSFALPVAVLNKDNTQVYVNGIYQEKSSYSIAGSTLAFSEAPVAGKVEIVVQSSLAIGEALANSVSYTPAGTGAVATTVQSKLRETVSVKDFGAVGDGVADDTAAIQAAVDSTTNGTVFIPDGIYLVSAPISLPYGVSLRGSSTSGATLKMKNGANAAAVLQTKNFPSLIGTTSTAGTLLTYIGDFTVDGNKANNTSGVGVRLYGKGYTFSNVMIHSCASIGLYTEYNGPDDFSSINGTIESVYENLSIQQNGSDGWYTKGPHDLSCSKIFSFSNGGWGWVVETSVKASSVNTYLNTNGGIWVRLSGVITGSDVTGNTGNSGFGMLIDTGTGATTISSGYFGGGGPGKAALAIRSPNHNIHGLVVMAGTGFGGDATNAGVRFEGNGSAKLDLMMSNLNCNWFVFAGGDNGGNSNVSVATQSIAGTLFSGTPNSIGTWHIAGGDNAHRFTQLSTQTINAGGWAPKLPSSNGTLVPVSYTSPAYSASITFDVGSKHYFLINPSNSSAFTINAPTGGVNGHIITVSILNGTAGALGTITWASNFKLAGGSFTSPGAYKMRSVTFVCIGSDWYELHRTSADV